MLGAAVAVPTWLASAAGQFCMGLRVSGGVFEVVCFENAKKFKQKCFDCETLPLITAHDEAITELMEMTYDRGKR